MCFFLLAFIDHYSLYNRLFNVSIVKAATGVCSTLVFLVFYRQPSGVDDTKPSGVEDTNQTPTAIYPV